VFLMLGPAVARAEGDASACGRAAGEAFGLLSWDNMVFKGSATSDDKKNKRPAVELSTDKKTFRLGVEHGLALAESVNYCRTLSETPPNIATPDYIAGLAKTMAKETGLKCTVFSGKDLEKEKLVGHINVGKASENKPCFIRLEYTPEKAKKGKDKPAVLIGKTMTYDTGGLSLKVNNGMVGMKRDKDGGCAVLGAMHAIATVVKPARPVVAYLCAAENSISDEAYRPDDILTYRNGVTCEITNTDAEGRLVLADGLAYACDKDDPAYIVDLATLTGGVVVALGSTFCGLFCEDDALRARVEKAAEASGERVWRLPMHAEYRDMMKSPIADILNSNPNRKAHPIQGAAFLSYFVKDNVPWCHLDIAGVHVAESDSGAFVKGSTGWGVRILADLLAQE
jgi:leucyl aminopeptidase